MAKNNLRAVLWEYSGPGVCRLRNKVDVFPLRSAAPFSVAGGEPVFPA
jgi:hypothetical protein